MMDRSVAILTAAGEPDAEAIARLHIASWQATGGEQQHVLEGGAKLDEVRYRMDY